MDKNLGIKYSFKQRCFESRFKSTKSGDCLMFSGILFQSVGAINYNTKDYVSIRDKSKVK